MGRQQNHRKKWLSNREFLSEIPSNRCDWATTVAFYTALHAVEILFAYDKTWSHQSHEERDDTLANSRYEPIQTSYMVLKNASRVARYGCKPSEVQMFSETHVRDMLIGKYLKQIEDFVFAEADPNNQHNVKPIEWPPAAQATGG